MPLEKARFTEYQWRRRAMEKPCQGCGFLGTASEVYKATPSADPVRCCPACHYKLMQALKPETLVEQRTIGDQIRPLIKKQLNRLIELRQAGMSDAASIDTARKEMLAKAAEMGYTEEQVRNSRLY